MRRSNFLAALALAGCAKQVELEDLGGVPPFAFTDAAGKRFSSDELRGKVWIADFFFTNCPGPCPRMAKQFRRVQDETKGSKDLRLVSITVDPDRDSPEVLAAYAKRQGADLSRWVFLTGRKDLVQSLMSEAMFLGFGDSLQEHSTKFVLVDKKMRIRGFYDSFPNVETKEDSITKLIKDIRDLHDRT